MIKKVIVTDIYGRRLKHFEPLQKKVWLNISDLSLGIYMVTIQYENSQTKTQRFIKH